MKISQELYKSILEATQLSDIGSRSKAFVSKDGSNVIKTPKTFTRQTYPPSNPQPNPYSEQEIKEFEFMQKHPEVFVEIKKIDNRFVIAERLFTNDIPERWGKLSLRLASHYGSLFELVDGIVEKNADWSIKSLKKVLSDKQSDDIQRFGLDLAALLEKLIKIDWRDAFKVRTLDIHGQNLGYDKNGALKLFDA